MFKHVLVGYEGSERSEDALALAQTLADPSRPVTAVCRYWYEPLSSRMDRGEEKADPLRHEADDMLTALSRRGVTTLAKPGASAAHTLRDAARSQNADLVVVGSTHRGRLGRVLAGTTGTGVMHGAPCAVAVAPGGYREHRPESLRRIGVAYVDTDEGHEALRIARDLAVASGAELTVLEVFHFNAALPALTLGFTMHADEQRDAVQTQLDAAVASLAGIAVPVHGELLEGGAAEALVARAEHLDLLVMGSRGHGPLGHVLLGSVSADVVANSACPVLVVPREALKPLSATGAANGESAG